MEATVHGGTLNDTTRHGQTPANYTYYWPALPACLPQSQPYP